MLCYKDCPELQSEMFSHRISCSVHFCVALRNAWKFAPVVF